MLTETLGDPWRKGRPNTSQFSHGFHVDDGIP